MTQTKTIINTTVKKIIGDTITPISVYLTIRDKFTNSLLLESSDSNSKNGSYSYICFNEMSQFSCKNNLITIGNLNQNKNEFISNNPIYELKNYIKSFETIENNYSFTTNGLFGYVSYNSVKYFDNIPLQDSEDFPEIQYAFYKNIIVLNHFTNEAYLICNSIDENNNINEIETIVNNIKAPNYKFDLIDNEETNIGDKEFLKLISKAQDHCKKGDVFQLVLSRQFNQKFKGDEFNVYRALRAINPSPYLFYFDYGNYKLFGSSPETQLKIENNIASINPIAGTYKRTGNDALDLKLAKKLSEDPKECAEHNMLVDLARNDLSRFAYPVQVKKYKEIEVFSHVIHLVSEVEGEIENSEDTLNMISSTFPAGTLSGAPKIKAMEIINSLETQNRNFYGGCIGILELNGNFNSAIFIRSFVSHNNTLFYQAGAGVVEKSVPERELQEVNNKLAALKKAIQLATNI